MSDTPTAETAKQFQNLRIVRLTAENVKRLQAVEIVPGPDQTMVPICGPNAAGKTSVLDCIEMGIGAKLPDKPMAEGAEHGRIELELADGGELRLLVERRFTDKGSYLFVSNEDGDRKQSPQKVLDQLYGAFTFDPLDFTRMKPAEQRRLLLELTGQGEKLEELETELKSAMGFRRERKKELGTLAGGLSVYEDLPEELPEVETAADIEGRRTKLRQKVERYDEQEQALAAKAQQLTSAQAVREVVGARIRELQEEMAIANESLENNANAITVAGQAVETAGKTLAKLTRPTDEEFAALTTAHEESQTAAALVERGGARDALKVEIGAKSTAVNDCEAAVTDIREELKATLREAPLPLEGLTYDEGGVSYNGIPFDQASSAEQLRVSLAMGMALNPDLRVMRITDGSLIDTKSWDLIAEAAGEAGYQVWVELVEEKEPVLETLDDGTVATDEDGQPIHLLGDDGEPLYAYPDIGVYLEEGLVQAVDGEPVQQQPKVDLLTDDATEAADAPTE